jgi:hypothetical protein
VLTIGGEDMNNRKSSKEELNVSQDNVAYLARLYGIQIEEDDLAEVTFRLAALLGELKNLDQFDLWKIEPVPIFLQREEK